MFIFSNWVHYFAMARASGIAGASKKKGRLHNVIQGLFIDRHCIRMVMDVFYFGPRDPASLEGERKKGEIKRVEQRRWNKARTSGEGCRGWKGGEKVERNEKARRDGLVGANHLVCIHLRRILFLRSLGLCLFSI